MTTTLTSLSFVGKQPSSWKGGSAGSGGGGGTAGGGVGGRQASSHHPNTSKSTNKNKDDTNDDYSGRRTRSVPIASNYNAISVASTTTGTIPSKSWHLSTSITTTNKNKSYQPCFSDSDGEEDEFFLSNKGKPSSKPGGFVSPKLSSASSSVIHRWKAPSSSSTTLSSTVPSTSTKTTDIKNKLASSSSSSTISSKAGFKNKIKRTRNIITMHRHVAISEGNDDDDQHDDGNDDTREEELDGKNKVPLSMHSSFEERQVALSSSSSSLVGRAKRFVVGTDNNHLNNHHRDDDDDDASSLLRYHRLEETNSTDQSDIQMDVTSPKQIPMINSSKNRMMVRVSPTSVFQFHQDESVTLSASTYTHSHAQTTTESDYEQSVSYPHMERAIDAVDAFCCFEDPRNFISGSTGDDCTSVGEDSSSNVKVESIDDETFQRLQQIQHTCDDINSNRNHLSVDGIPIEKSRSAPTSTVSTSSPSYEAPTTMPTNRYDDANLFSSLSPVNLFRPTSQQQHQDVAPVVVLPRRTSSLPQGITQSIGTGGSYDLGSNSWKSSGSSRRIEFAPAAAAAVAAIERSSDHNIPITRSRSQEITESIVSKIFSPPGIHRSISNDRLYSPSNVNKKESDSKGEKVNLTDAFWTDIFQEDDNTATTNDDRNVPDGVSITSDKRALRSILVSGKTPRSSAMSCPPGVFLNSAETAFSYSTIHTSATNLSKKQVAFDKKMQVRYFSRTDEERQEMIEHTIEQKRNKKQKKKKAHRKLLRLASLLELASSGHHSRGHTQRNLDNDNSDDEDDSDDGSPTGLETLWKGFRMKRSSKRNHVPIDKLDLQGLASFDKTMRKIDFSNGNSTGRLTVGGLVSTAHELQQQNKLKLQQQQRMEGTAIRSASNRPWSPLRVTRTLSPLRGHGLSTKNQKQPNTVDNFVAGASSCRTINVKKRDSSTSLMQGMFDDISGLFGFSSGTNGSSNDKKTRSQSSKSSKNGETASTESVSTESEQSSSAPPPSSKPTATGTTTTLDSSSSKRNDKDFKESSYSIKQSYSGNSYHSQGASSKKRSLLFDTPFVTMENLSCISPNNDDNENEGERMIEEESLYEEVEEEIEEEITKYEEIRSILVSYFPDNCGGDSDTNSVIVTFQADEEQKQLPVAAANGQVPKNLFFNIKNNESAVGYECFTASNLVAAGKALQEQHRTISFSDDSVTSIYEESWLCGTFKCA